MDTLRILRLHLWYFLDKYFYAIGGYSKCSCSNATCDPCPSDIGYSDRIWKFEPDNPQPSNEDYTGKFVEVIEEEGCVTCRLKYGLTDVSAIVLPQYLQNEVDRDFKGGF